jgi:GNAT superfamily N-acetyltransferase
MPTITYRCGLPEDSYAAFEIYQAALLDFSRRQGFMAITGGEEPQVLANLWQRRRPLFEHLARTADQFWVAEYMDSALADLETPAALDSQVAPVGLGEHPSIQSKPQIIGYARSIVRDRVRELTEFFVHPNCQASGVGKELLRRALPGEANDRHKVIIATTDTPALVHYLKDGVSPYFPTATFSRPPRRMQMPASLEATRLPGGLPTGPLSRRIVLHTTGLVGPPDAPVLPALATPTLAILSSIDLQVLGYTRPADHTWLMGHMDGYIYRWNGQVIGYGYVSEDGGPFALIYPTHFPDVLTHAEHQAAQEGFSQFYLEVPLINRNAVDWLLSNGYRMSSFLALFMSESRWGSFEDYIFPSPPFFL